jgi:manganese transport protein
MQSVQPNSGGPKVQRRNFLTRLVAYSGPALIVSVAYMDPGNYGTDLAGGAGFNYDLLWVVWLASLMAMLFQYLSGKLGIATGEDLASHLRTSLGGRRRFTVPYWLAAEAAIASTDLAEYLGTVLALNLLFGVPLLYAAVFGAADVVIILAVTSRRFRIVESLFALWVSIIGLGLLYEVFITHPSASAVALHSVLPIIDSKTIAIAVGVIGATVMPHAVFVHSWLTKNKLKTGSIEERGELLKLHLTETVLLLSIAAAANVAIMVMSASAFYPDYKTVQSVSQAYGILIPLFGPQAAVIFGITLLASGLSSSITGTLSGQAIMDGLLGIRVNPYLRRLVTRVVNVAPTTVAILLGYSPLEILVYSQVLLSLLLPLAVIPLIILTARRSVMGEFVNRKVMTFLGAVASLVIVLLNSYLLVSFATGGLS